MNPLITESLVDDICRRAVQTDPVSPTTWESLEPMVQLHLRSTCVEFLTDVLPILPQHGWIEPLEAM